MIVLLLCSTNLLASNQDSISSAYISSKGVLYTDNCVLISYDNIRKVNAKLIELEYEKEINKNLKEIIINDSIAISRLQNYIDNVEVEHKSEVKSLKKKLVVAEGCSAGAIILLIIALL